MGKTYTETTIAQVIKALEKSGGRVADAAHSLGISYQALHKRINHHEELRERLDHIRERHLDLAESKVIAAMKKNAPWAICFYLKCQGKHRGWVETRRQEVTGADGGPIETQEKKPDFSRLSKDELRQLHELSEKLYSTDQAGG